MKRKSAGEYEMQADTTLDGKPAAVTFTICRDEAADRIQGRALWPITASVNGIGIKQGDHWLVLEAGSWLRESREVAGRLATFGFKTVDGIPMPTRGIGCYT